ncbi:MAG: hypothetical protein A2Y38_11870 [Spirochaetes bacterium GWB1_59_5]|nr:MAG: hypothetical protein A2Y38_11870 [Spirochaetes bacterium GWB1_59_5]
MYQEFQEPEKYPSWDELQRGIADEAGLEDVPGFTKDASFVGKELINTLQGTPYANSQLLNEELELERHVKRMVEEKHPYVVLEKSLHQSGYQVPNIRRVFQKVTGIDPVRAYLDMSNYPIPPGVVPRYNYGWGVAKEGADYFFILPWTDKYGMFRVKGIERELVDSFYLLADARKKLEGKVKKFHDVTPDAADIITDLIQKVANFTKLTPRGAEFFNKMSTVIDTAPEMVVQSAIEAVDSGIIEPSDFQIIAEHLVLAAPTDYGMDLSAPERVDEKAFREFQQDQNMRSFRETKNNTLMPGQEFASNWESQRKVDFWGLLSESREMFQELASTIDGFRVEPSWGTFKIMPTPSLATDDDNHILDGSVAVGSSVQRLDSTDQSEIAILFFIHNGKLKYSGKFKGVNDREYAFSTMGLDDYFDDLAGSSGLDESVEHGLSATPPSSTMENGPVSRP